MRLSYRRGETVGKNCVSGLLIGCFLGAEGLLYGVFLYGDLTGEDTVVLKYGSILLCLLFSVFWSVGGGDKLVTAALAFTLGADTFLLLLDAWYLAGVLLFCAVQALYLMRVCRENGGRTLWPLRLGLLVFALWVLARLEMLSLLNGVAALYFTTFLWNVVQSLSLRGTQFRLFSLGLILFLCCDVCVGAFNQPALVPAGVYSFAQVGMWLFYLPAQVLIALSGLPDFVLRGHDHEKQ